MRPVQAVVVAYGSPPALNTCLIALGPSISVVVVDNSSSPDVEKSARANRATYVDPGRNIGFAAGVNVALRRLAAEPPHDVLLLNPDAVLAEEDLHALTAYLHRPGNERVAAVAPRLIDSSGTAERVVWPFPSPGRAWLDTVGLGGRPSRQTFTIGAVLLLRREALDEVGYFDERFFLYAEETDWQRRARDRGWVSDVCHEAVATHVGAASSTDESLRETLFHAAQETYIRKWFGSRGWMTYRTAAVVGAAARAAVLKGDRRAGAAQRLRLYLRGPSSCAARVHN